MRSLTSFASLLALGLLVGGGLTLTTGEPGASALSNGVDGTGGFDFRSLLIGLLLGVLLSNLSRVSWTELPRRFIAWLLNNEHNVYYVAAAAIFIAVLVFY